MADRAELRPTELRPPDLLAAFFAPAVAFLVLAAAAATVYLAGGWAPGRWLALHLAFLGGISQLVLGASQYFATAFLATSPPSRRLICTQLVTWNAGTLLVVTGVGWSQHLLTATGGATLLIALALLAAAFRRMRRSSLQRVPWATRWYRAATCFLAVGVALGALIAVDAPWSSGSLLAAHVALGVGGWFGSAIVGTLHTFYPSLTETRLRLPSLQPVAFAAWTIGVAALAAGYGLDAPALPAIGWGALSLGASALAANLVASARRVVRPLSLPARLVTVAQCMLVIGVLVALVTTIVEGAAPPSGSTRSALAVLLLAGWVGLTVMGSLLQLLAVILRTRGVPRALPVARPGRDGPLVGLAGAALLALAAGLLVPLGPVVPAAGVTLAATYLLLLAWVVTLMARAIARGDAEVPVL